MDNNKIGHFILELRKEKGLTQQELGNKLFVTDKAVSKWERGLSLPDITLLEKLALELDVDVSEILRGQRGKKKIDINKVLEEETNKIKNKNKKKMTTILIPIIIFIIIILILLFKNIFLGYEIKTLNYKHSAESRDIKIGIPKLSFMTKNNDRSYSFKNLRSSHVLETEIKKYLKELKYLSCNDTIYYYDEDNDISIINYSVKDKILYSTISYEIADGDYCYSKKLSEYSLKLGGLKKYHSMNDKISYYEDWDSKLSILFLDGGDNSNKEYEFKATMKVMYYKRKDELSAYYYTLEESSGNIEIKENKLYYYRTAIKEQADDINIPEVSVFLIKDASLILIDNYLSDYETEIILK